MMQTNKASVKCYRRFLILGSLLVLLLPFLLYYYAYGQCRWCLPGDALWAIRRGGTRLAVQSVTEPTTVTKPTVKNSRFRGHILAVNVDQQLTGGLLGFSQLSMFGDVFNLSTVEPYVRGSILIGVPEPKDTVIKLSDLYDREFLVNHFKKCAKTNDHRLSSFENFMRTGSRDVVLLFMISDDGTYRRFFSKKNKNKKVVEIPRKDSLLGNLKRLNRWSSHVSSSEGISTKPFKLRNIVGIDGRQKHSLQFTDVVRDLGRILKNRAVTVLVERWIAVTSKAGIGYYYYIPDFPWQYACLGVQGLEPSSAVVNTALEFANSLNEGNMNRTRVGVHLRGERLILQYKGNLMKCFESLSVLLRNFTEQLNASVTITHDLGSYGTSSCGGRCNNRKSNFLSNLRNLSYTMASYSPEEGSSPILKNPGFVSFVEREYLSRVDILVTVGWGGFQSTILGRFIKRHHGNKTHIHHICSSPNSLLKRR